MELLSTTLRSCSNLPDGYCFACSSATHWLAWLLGTFIFNGGIAHVMDMWTVWRPDHDPLAFARLATEIALWPLLPKALKLPSVRRLETAIGELEAEVRKRRSAEEHLNDAEQSLALTLASIGAGFIAADRDGCVTRMNAVAEQITGWPQAEASGRGLWEVFQRDGRPAAYAAMNPLDVLVQQGITLETVHHVTAVSRDDLRTAVEVRTALTHDSDGGVRGLAMVLRDMTELLRAQAESERLAAIVESSSDAIIGKTLEGIITSWNSGAERLFGYPAEEAIGQPMQMLMPPDRVDEEPRILARLARGEHVEHFETVRRRKDGTLIDISTVISPVLDDSGRVIGASKIARDITERRQADARLSAQLQRLKLLDQITCAIGERQDMHSIYQVTVRSLEDELPADFACVLNHDAVTNALTLTGIGVRSDVLLPDLVKQESVPIDPNRLARCLGGELVYDVDTQAAPFPLAQRLAAVGLRSLVIAPLRSQSRVFGLLVAARHAPQAFSDGECEFIQQLSSHVALAAHQAQLHAQLQDAFDELRRTQQAALQQERLSALGQMASGIAHDINNAISPAVLYAETLLEHETLSDRARGYVQSIGRAVDDVAATVARMREFYRGRAPELPAQPVALDVLVRQVIELSRARWSDMPQQRGVVIEVIATLAPDLPFVWGAESDIREALINLVFNAVDAMPQGGTLTLATRRIDADDGEAAASARLLLEVTDTGIGMDDATRRRCLEPFFTTKGERGTGLGLAMVYGTAQRHGAQITIDSTRGAGTTVRLAFPLQVRPLPTVAPAGARPARRLHLLLVDDDPVLLRSLREALEGDGHRAETVNGGQAGIDAFAAALQGSTPFDVVITDLGMPHIDGRRVASAIKQLSPKTPILLLTGWGQRTANGSDAPADVDLVLSKPPRLADLRAGLAACLEAGGKT